MKTKKLSKSREQVVGVPAAERWLHEPEMKRRLAEADKWFQENMPQETSLDELEFKIKSGRR